MKLAELEIDQLHASKTNQRQEISGKALDELMASIQAVGLLNPILVRKNQDGYEIIAGHRRFAALQRLNAKMVPVQIMEVTGEDAVQIQIIENLQRQDLNPIEEAKAFDIFYRTYNLSEGEIAARADKSLAYITRALALLNLNPKTQAMIASGTLSAAHGHQIMRVEGKQRETIEAYATTINEWTKKYPSLDDLKDEIEKKVEKDLEKAVFPKDVDNYGGTETPACGTCKFNSGNQNVLFDGAEKGSCTNPGCYNKRTTAWYKNFQAEAQAKFPKLKFIGLVASLGYMGHGRQLKGFPVVDQKKAKAALEKTPEKFGFAIVKPSIYEKNKKPQIFLVSLDKDKASKSYLQEEQQDWERERFIKERINICLIELANKSVPELDKKHVIQMLEVDADEKKRLIKKNMSELMKIQWLQWLGDWEVEEKLEAVGIECDGVAKAAAKEAGKMYDEAQKNKKELKS